MIFSGNIATDLSNPSDDEIDDEFEFEGDMTRALRRKLGEGSNYYGVSITRKNGIVITRNAPEPTSRTVFNSDEWLVEIAGIPRLYADFIKGTLIFNGEFGADVVIATDVITENIFADFGMVADLLVNAIKTDYKRAFRYLAGDTSPVHYTFIHDEKDFKITSETDGSETVHFTNAHDEPIYWRDEIGGQMTTHPTYRDEIEVIIIDPDTGEPLIDPETGEVETEWVWADVQREPVIVFVYTDLVKYENSFDTFSTPWGEFAAPIMKFGAGSGNGDNGKLLIWKDWDGPRLRYISLDGLKSASLHAKDDGYWYHNNVRIGNETHNITVLRTGWVASSAFPQYTVQYDVTEFEIGEKDIGDIVFDAGSVIEGNKAGVLGGGDVINGIIRLYAERRPAADLTGLINIVRG
jgi:hypothetical protein